MPPPLAQETFAALRDARLRLAELVMVTPSTEPPEGYRKNLASANEKKELLEKKLAEVNEATAHDWP